ncbi:hypothetical protein [Polymorphospora lycopeni]|uniref:DUF2567 domain-containing protein n=1 Tax=Polymorphospora lycopeni TaxID=3140240 RepID=A0ABV5CNC4_9ACTN
MANPKRRTHTTGTVIATVLLVACGMLLGIWLASAYDVLRVNVLDNALANQLGYIGEITDASVDPLPHGLSRFMLIVIFVAGIIGGLATYAAAVVSRRAVGDREAIAYALGCWLLGAAAGFAWLATDWPAVELDLADAFGTFIHVGGVWVPLVLLGIGVLCLLVWWVHPGADGELVDGGPEAEQGHA